MSDIEITLKLADEVKSGDTFYLYVDGVGTPSSCTAVVGSAFSCRVGDRLSGGNVEFLVRSTGWLPGAKDTRSTPWYLLEALLDAVPGEFGCNIVRKGYSLAWITLSDKGARGERVDESGPLIGMSVGERLDLDVIQGFVIPDEEAVLKGLLVDLALNQGFDIIMTTGGTGVAPRDITPEATLAVVEKRLPGFERAMTAASLSKTPHGAISRAVAGTLGQAIVVNMPGSPKAVAECLEPLLPTLRHSLEKLQGDPSDCATV